MTLEGYKQIAPASTLGGAPIDSSQVDAFRSNDVLFEKLIQALMCSPFMPSSAIGGIGTGDVVINKLGITDADNNVLVGLADVAKQFINAKSIHLTAKCSLTPSVPLIWIARDRITISAEIDAVGKGAQSGETGDFGGSGGGALKVGFDCVMPFVTIGEKEEEDVKSRKRILKGGAMSNSGLNLQNAEAWKLSRALLYLPWLKGGASGADNGGAGGGVICLCAPIIEIKEGGKINAAGANASDQDKGGGGGGFVYLVGRQILNTVEETTVFIKGGIAPDGGFGKAGGNGMYVKHEFK
jgi:hypothetical protein